MAQGTFVGNLTGDPELAYTQAGLARCNFSVAENRRFKRNGSDDWDETVSFWNCTAWGDLAENVAESFSKGDRVVCTGRFEMNYWENDAGEKRSAVKFVADEVSPSLRWATVKVVKNDRREPGTSKARHDERPPVDEEPF